MKYVDDNLIYVTLAGSQAYGLSNELSDTDVKGICIPPPDVEYNLFHKFEQAENLKSIENSLSHLKNPKNPKFESTVYSLKKFFLLASDVNPNIIELLYTNPKHHFVKYPIMEEILDNRHIFLSMRARHTFSGYAMSQAKKIERHRKWILKGNVKEPTREEFGLLPEPSIEISQILSYIKGKVEQWNLTQYPLDEYQRLEIKNIIWEIIYNTCGKDVSISNWPDEYWKSVLHKMANELNLKEEVLIYINAEREYYKAKQLYNSWVSWNKERNPQRKELEIKFGYDLKHASHLIRLMRMGYEIISTGKVIVDRTNYDADELLQIKNGYWTYDKVLEFKDEMESKLNDEYKKYELLVANNQPTPIPMSVNKTKINEFYHKLYNSYWN